MKIWWVLAWEQHYPSSGLGNVYSTHETEEEAKDVADTLKARNPTNYDYVEVVNIKELGYI
jgi:hypothetical protein